MLRRSQAGPLLALVALMLAGAAARAPAQVLDEIREGEQEAPIPRVSGRLLDAESGAPIDRAFIALEPLGRRALSDSTGAFTFQDVQPGSYTLRVQHIAYGVHSAGVEAEVGRTTWLELRLAPEAIALEPLRVEIESRPRFLERNGFYERMERGLGAFFDPRFVERWSVGVFAKGDRLLRLMRDVAPSFSPSEHCPVEIYVDGRLDRTELVAEMSSWEIGAVEMYSSMAGTPDFVHGCGGAVIVWTNRWRGEKRRPDPVVLCAPRAEEGTLTVEGIVRDRHTDVPLPGARVVANLSEPGAGTLRTLETRADSAGRYRLCDLAAEARVDLRAGVLGLEGDGATVESSGRSVLFLDLAVELAGPGRLVGRVSDRRTGRPLEGAAVTVGETGREAVADAQGYFALDDLPPGDHQLRFAYLGYAPHAEPVSVRADRTLEVRARLSPDPVALEPIIVTALRDIRLERRGFYERREWGERVGAGHFFDREAVRRRNPLRVTHLLGDLPRVRLECAGGRGCLVRSITSPTCSHMTVYVDGVRMMSGDGGRTVDYSLDDLVNVAEVAALEVYTGAASIPAEYAGSDAQCGVVAIWTG